MKPKPTTLTRYAITVEYDGSAFSGFQLQKKDFTVQAALEKAVYTRFKEHQRVVGVSRTDAGVHARGQVALFKLAYPLPVEKMVAALNSALPYPVKVLTAKKVPMDWEPHRATKNKTYTYLVYDREIFSPLWKGRTWQVMQKLDIAAMRQAAKHLVGTHDFTSFRASGCVAHDPVREMLNISISKQGDLLSLRFTATAFLYNMVRILAGTLVEVGKGRITATQVKAILAAKNRKLAGRTAPACGLYLDKIRFKG
jgi:tRNA pseudouridine38-40 synthase